MLDMVTYQCYTGTLCKIHGIIQYIIGYEIEGDLLDRYPAWYFMGWSLAREVGCMPRLLSLACS